MISAEELRQKYFFVTDAQKETITKYLHESIVQMAEKKCRGVRLGWIRLIEKVQKTHPEEKVSHDMIKRFVVEFVKSKGYTVQDENLALTKSSNINIAWLEHSVKD